MIIEFIRGQNTQRSHYVSPRVFMWCRFVPLTPIVGAISDRSVLRGVSRGVFVGIA